MSRFPTFNEYTQILERESLYYGDHKKHLLESLLNSEYNFNRYEILSLEYVLENNFETEFFSGNFSETLNEISLVDWIKDKAESAKDIIKTKGKEALSATQEFVVNIGANIGNYVKKIVEMVTKAIKMMWDKITAFVEKVLGGKKKELIEKAKGEIKGKESKLKEEIGNAKSMLQAGAKWVSNGFTKDSEGGLQKAAKDDSGDSADESMRNEISGILLEKSVWYSLSKLIKEDERLLKQIIEIDHSVYESDSEGLKIPGISKLLHTLHKYPPFSLMHKATEKFGKVVNSSLESLSKWLNSVAGAPGPFEFTVFGTVSGMCLHIVWDAASEFMTHGIMGIPYLGHILHAIPGVSTVGYVMLGIATIQFAIDLSEIVSGEGSKEH